MSIIQKIDYEKGRISLLDDCSMLFEGQYYIIRDKKIVSSNTAVKIKNTDILRIGLTSYSCFQYLLYGCVLFVFSKIINKFKKTIKFPINILSFTDAFSDLSFLTVLLNMVSIGLFIASIFMIAKYIISHKKLFEVNTPYGRFCISYKKEMINAINSFINHYNRLKHK